jgi:predicted PurR-regulated permease PerM
VAYAVFPLVKVLNQFLPRLLAALVASAVGFGTIGAVLAVIVPPLIQQSVAIATGLPNSSDATRIHDQVYAYLATLPDTTRSLVEGVLDRMSSQFSAYLSGLLDAVAAFAFDTLLHLFNTIGNVLGMVLLPIWVLYVVRDGDQVSRTIERQFPPGIRPDAMALLRIVNRALGTFIRVQLAGALLTGIGVWLGMVLLERYGVVTYNREIAVAGFAGLVQVIPQVGWLLGLVPAVINLAVNPGNPLPAAVYVGLYLLVIRAVNLIVGQRMGRILSVRSSVAVPAVVLLSGLGLIPLLLSAPLLVIGRDTVLYLRGRLSEPASPAGVLPGERAFARPDAARRPVPPIYALAAGATRVASRPPSALGSRSGQGGSA